MTGVSADDAKGVRVLLVEDESLIRLMQEDMLAALGHDVVAQAQELDSAIAQAQEADYDLAILDVNLNGERVFPAAEAVRMRGKPMIFVTGYGRAGLPPDFSDAILLDKPFDEMKLGEAIGRAISHQA